MSRITQALKLIEVGVLDHMTLGHTCQDYSSFVRVGIVWRLPRLSGLQVRAVEWRYRVCDDLSIHSDRREPYPLMGSLVGTT